MMMMMIVRLNDDISVVGYGVEVALAKPQNTKFESFAQKS